MSLSALASQDPVTSPVLWLVRHGESTWNAAGLAQGQSDQAELTSRGLRQAAEAAELFRERGIRAIHASDLRRARQTAAEFGRVLGLPVRADARLRERSLGVLEGTLSAAIGPSVTGLSDGRVTDPDARPYGGESLRDLYARAAAFCAALTIGDGDEGGDAVIVAHGGTVRVLEACLRGIPVEEMAWAPVENARVVRVPVIRAQPLPT